LHRGRDFCREIIFFFLNAFAEHISNKAFKGG
jgi:hypothetical protein